MIMKNQVLNNVIDDQYRNYILNRKTIQTRDKLQERQEKIIEKQLELENE